VLLWCKQSASDSEILLLYLRTRKRVWVVNPHDERDGYFKNYYEY